jgi:DNA-binding beta-propeller fold protein YncE
MSPLKVEEQLRALREQALGREPGPDAWPRLQRRLHREPTRRAVLVAGLVLVVLAVAVAPGLLARRAAEQPLGPMGGTPVVPGDPVVTARIRLDRPVGYFAVGFGAIWATGQDALVRIDLRTNRVVATIPMRVEGPEEAGGSIAFGEGAVWVVSSSETAGVVYRVDPAANRITASIPVRAGAVEVVVAAGTVWVSGGGDPGERFVSRIDARTNKLLPPISVPTNPGPIRAGLDAVWVVDCCTFGRIDPRRGSVTEPADHVGDIWEVGGGALWGTYSDDASGSGVQRVDPDTGRVVARIPIPHELAMAFGLGTLWVAQNTSSPPNSPGPGSWDNLDRTKSGRLYRIDPTTNRVLGRPLTLPRILPAPYFGVAVGEGTVVVKDIDQRTLTRIELVP